MKDEETCNVKSFEQEVPLRNMPQTWYRLPLYWVSDDQLNIMKDYAKYAAIQNTLLQISIGIFVTTASAIYTFDDNMYITHRNIYIFFVVLSIISFIVMLVSGIIICKRIINHKADSMIKDIKSRTIYISTEDENKAP